MDHDGDDGQIIHPCPGPGDAGEQAERAVTAAAREAVLAVAGPVLEKRLVDAPGLLIPIRKHISHAAVVGLLRLRYRPRTGATTAWLSQESDWAAWRDRYLDIAENPTFDALKRRA